MKLSNDQQQEARELADRLAASNDLAAVTALYMNARHDVSGRRYANAEILLRRARELCAKAGEPDAVLPEQVTALLGLVCLRQKNTAEAKTLQVRALALNQRRVARGKATQPCSVLRRLADALDGMTAAKRVCKSVVQQHTKAFGTKHPMVGQALCELAWCYEEAGARPTAELLYRRAYNIAEQSHRLPHGNDVHPFNVLAYAFLISDGAAPVTNHAWKQFVAMVAKATKSAENTSYNVAGIYVELGNHDDIVWLYPRETPLEKDSTQEENLTSFALRLVDANLAMVAEVYLWTVMNAFRRVDGPLSEEFACASDALAQVYARTNRPNEAKAFYQLALTICRHGEYKVKKLKIQEHMAAL